MNKYNLNKNGVINSLGYDNKIKGYIRKNLIFLTVSGSHAYGTNTPTSDMDIRGIFIGEKRNILGNDHIEQFENTTNDTVIYELSKAINLIAENNPNMAELMFCDEEDIIFATEEYWNIRKDNKKFLASIARFKYSGYAMSQLKRVKGHSKWLSRELVGEFKNKPEMIDYCRFINSESGYTTKEKFVIESKSKVFFLTHETNTIFKVWRIGGLQNGKGWFDNDNCTFYFKEDISLKAEFQGLLFFAKDEFNQALDQYNKWKNWKENRNETRHELENNFNYDTKHAMHLVRLLRMGKEILIEGKVNIKRPDATELLDIRNGKWSYDKLLEYAENMDKVILENAYKNTYLPHSVDKEFVNNILINTYESFWKKSDYPDYTKCTDERKEVYWNICKCIKKNDIMICGLNNKPCIAWKEYKYGQ
jgi:hypothetical protein